MMINIAIDGPAGAGKSTVAKAVAKKLNFIYLDTGAMYRAVAYSAIKNGIAITDEQAISEFVKTITMDIAYDENGEQQIFVFDENVTPYIRQNEISKAASDVSAYPAVRYRMVELQRIEAGKNNVVLDGRDIGTFVLPNAEYKFFMTASPEVRAKRRYDELLARGQSVDYDKVLNDIITRDYNDSHRAVAPLKQAEDAVYLDTSNMTVEEVTNFIIDRIKL
ncbi:MAG: (d)CMP kinase [Clostridiales bacterium]|nr:(d)CMP kinase [Clostridiales bacterium]